MNALIGMPQGFEWLIILGIVVLLFGARKLPEMARGTGKALKIFKDETKDLSHKDKDAEEEHAQLPQQASQPVAQPTVQPVQQQMPQQAPQQPAQQWQSQQPVQAPTESDLNGHAVHTPGTGQSSEPPRSAS